MVDLAKLTGLADWPSARKEIKSAVLSLLGRLPGEHAELQVKTVDEMSFPGYVRRRVNYFVDDWARVSAWLFVPEGKAEDEVPAVLCCHQEVPEGKDEVAGVSGRPTMAFAQRYAELGYVTIAPDCITAGERKSTGLAAYDTESFYKDYPQMSAVGKMLVDHMHAIDVLCETRRVDGERIGVIGHGLGGANAVLLAAFDERVRACVASCGFTRFAVDTSPGRWCRQDGFVGFPGLGEAAKSGKVSFDWEHILALAAPTPILLLTALNDKVLPHTKSCGQAAKLARGVYKFLGAEDALININHREGRRMTPEHLAIADEWLERWL